MSAYKQSPGQIGRGFLQLASPFPALPDPASSETTIAAGIARTRDAAGPK
jgi:hypothetical protein